MNNERRLLYCNTRTHIQVCVELQVEIDLVVTVAWHSRTNPVAKNCEPPSTFRQLELQVTINFKGKIELYFPFYFFFYNLTFMKLENLEMREIIATSFLLPPFTCRSKAVTSPVEEWEGQTSASPSGQSRRQPWGLYISLEPVLLSFLSVSFILSRTCTLRYFYNNLLIFDLRWQQGYYTSDNSKPPKLIYHPDNGGHDYNGLHCSC